MNVAVIGAGGPAGANVVRSLRAAGHDVLGIDGNDHHLGLIDGEKVKQPYRPFDPAFRQWLNEICEERLIDFVHAQPDEAVEVLARYGDELSAAVLVPKVQTILLCQDKFETAWRWKRDALRLKPVVKLEVEEQIHEAIEEMGLPLWMRATRGAGGRGSTPVDSHEVALNWWRYWLARKVDWDWILEEYLPGRDYAWTSLWFEGELVVSQGRERLEYIYPHLAPSGRTGTPTVAVTISDAEVNRVATEAVRSIDDEPHGLYCVDLREDSDGVPRPTEINAGRLFTTAHFYTAAGVNIPDLCVRLATGTAIEDRPPPYDPLPAGLFWIRHIDCPARLMVERDGTLVEVGPGSASWKSAETTSGHLEP